MRILLALLAVLALARPALAQEAANPRVSLNTSAGRIVLELETSKAPLTAGNFLKYVDGERYDGAAIYRASKPPGVTGTDNGFIQGGLEGDVARMLPPIPHESTLQTGLRNTSGAIAMARNAPGTARANWFIMVGDQTYLDADPKDPESPGYATFGRVVEGMDVVQSILGMPTDPDLGDGVMKGEMLANPVKIVTARRVAP